MSLLGDGTEEVAGLPHGVRAWATTRAAGSFGLGSREPVEDAMARWSGLQEGLAAVGVHRLASAHQTHGVAVARHGGGWQGWLRMRGIDAHVTTTPGTALAVTVADCTPVVVAHPRGAAASVHAGWRGTAGGILTRVLETLDELGYPAAECTVHLGPAICGDCYEVGPEVLEAVHGRPFTEKGMLDTRDVLAEQAAAFGVARVTRDPGCTRCDNDRFFSHRAGDQGRLLGIVALLPEGGADAAAAMQSS